MKLNAQHPLVAMVVVLATSGPQRAPAEVARELLQADRKLAAASAQADVTTGLSRAFASIVVLPVRASGTFARGRNEAIALLRHDSTNASSRLTWSPIRAGVSADGQHGFTYGYTTLSRPDGSTVPGKYVAYWEREGGAWRISVYRRAPRPAGDVALAERPPALPPRSVPPRHDSAQRLRLTKELADTERAFSRDALGGVAIGAAFARYGDRSAANVGRGPSFVFGADSIGAMVQSTTPAGTLITWEPEETRVASSGDLGVTIGIITIRPPATAGAERPTTRVPYFTIWRRDDVRGPWLYVAE